MKRAVVAGAVVLALCAFLTPVEVHAQKLPVYSANGFKCSKTPLSGSSMDLITCEGSFPKDDGNLSASGYASVSLTYGKGGNVYSYSSLTGCLMKATATSTAATNRKGKTQTFSAGDFSAANEYCSK